MSYFAKKTIWIFCILTLLAPFSSGFTTTSGLSASSGKQIVLLLDDQTLKFTSVKIEGYNQNFEWKTWSKQDAAGFKMAYTKNWWWAENFVRINLVIQDSQTKQSYTKTCLIDVLEQPKDSPRVEIMYNRSRGCIGGNAGNAQDPIQKAIKPVRDSFATVAKFTAGLQADFKQDVFEKVFMETLYIELNVIGCVGGVALAFQTGGYSYAIAKPIVTKACWTTGDKMMKLFVKP
jgi:hypothetical protein